MDRDAEADAGDLVIVPFDLPVIVNDSSTASFVLPVAGDTFGSGATVIAGPRANEVSVVLGDGAVLKTRQHYTESSTERHPASGIGLADTIARDAIENAVTGDDAIPGVTLDIVPAFVDGAKLALDPVLAVAVADFDRDGAPDAVVATTAGGAELLLGDGEGGLEPELPFGTSVASALACGDVDADGDLDVVLGGPDGLQVWVGDGDGAFLPGIAPHWLGAVSSVALADLDLDGDLDAVAQTDSGLGAFVGDGFGSFSDPDFFAGALVAQVIATADADHDGRAEIFAGTSDGVRVFHSAGSSYEELTTFAGTDVRALALADVDGDGQIDVLTGEQVGSSLWIGDGGGAFAPASVGLPDVPCRAVFASDVDSDGKLDLLVDAPDGLHVLFQTEPGSFVDSDQAVAATATSALGGGDLDLDGDLDLVLVAENGDVRTAFGSLAGTWGEVSFHERGSVLSDGVTFALAAGDLDSDGDLDLIAGQNNRLEVLRGAGNGSFAPAESIYEVPDQRVNDIAVGDVDLDGDLDLVLGLQVEAEITWLNDGAGHFAAFDQTQQPDVLIKTVDLGDIDQDGDLDLVQGTMNHEPDAVRRNLGRAEEATAGAAGGWLGFGPLELLTEDGEPILAHTGVVRFADFDRDGDLDLFCGYGSNQDERWFRNDGTGIFTIQPQILGDLDCRAVTVGDIDRDGDQDLVTGTNIGEHVLLNDGTGEFLVFDDLSVSSTYDVQLVDLTGDGAVDLLIGNSLEQGLGAWLNDGTGRFGTVPWIRLSHRSVRAIQTGDFDRDGDIDLISTNITDPSVRIWMNR
jgi:hypothetical protein